MNNKFNGTFRLNQIGISSGVWFIFYTYFLKKVDVRFISACFGVLFQGQGLRGHRN
jgi:hypothetical protein